MQQQQQLFNGPFRHARSHIGMVQHRRTLQGRARSAPAEGAQTAPPLPPSLHPDPLPAFSGHTDGDQEQNYTATGVSSESGGAGAACEAGPAAGEAEQLEHAKALSRHISAAPTWQELRALLRAHREDMNPYHVVAMLYRLSVLLGAVSQYKEARVPPNAHPPGAVQAAGSSAAHAATDDSGSSSAQTAGHGTAASAAGGAASTAVSTTTMDGVVPPRRVAAAARAKEKKEVSWLSALISLTAIPDLVQFLANCPATGRCATALLMAHSHLVHATHPTCGHTPLILISLLQIAAFINGILAVADPLIQDFELKHVVGSLHTLARLRHRPPAPWALAVLERGREVLPDAR